MTPSPTFSKTGLLLGALSVTHKYIYIYIYIYISGKLLGAAGCNISIFGE